ncbi:MAG: GldG family protein [Melioribacteraceae bacterium]|nr:MAG: GldG family protein [Melioribacteraceae bacterium]
MLTKRKIQISLAFIVGILVLVNFISDKFFLRLDFTEDQRYSLSEATKNILTELQNPVTVSAYFSEELPPDIAKVRRDFRDLLIEYSNRSGGNVVYEFINPSENEETEMKAQQSGISPIMINVREKDQMKQQRAYLGAVVQMGEKKEAIPLIRPGAAMEYELSSAIKKISVNQKPKIALVQGHGEPSLMELPQAQQKLNVIYDVEEFTITDTTLIPNNYEALLIVAPKDTIPQSHLTQLDNYINNGGRLLLALNRVEGDLQNARGVEVYTGLEDWLAQKGITIENKLIIDVNSSQIMVRQEQGGFVMNTPVRFPYLPIITNFNEHPITEGLEQVLFPFASPIIFNPQDTAIGITPIAFTSEKSGTENSNTFFDISREWNQTNFNQSNLVVAVAVENDIGRMIVFGDGDFIINGSGQNQQRLNEDNVNLFVNAVDWLADDTGLIQLRTKGVTGRPIDPTLEDGTKALLKYLNFLLPIFAIILYGVYRFQIKRKLKTKLMNVDYD